MAIDFPNSPTSGDLYTAGGKTWQWNGTYWAAYGTGPVLRTSDTPPASPNAGDLWYETDTGRFFTYIDSAWVEIGNATDIAGALQPSQVTALSAVTTLTSDDIFPVVDGPSGAVASSKITYGNLVTNMSSSLAPGLVYITSALVINAASLSISNCFTSAYDNYRIVYNCQDSSAIGALNFRWRTGTTDQTGAGYYYGYNQNTSAATAFVGAGAVTSAQIATRDSNAFYPTSGTIEIPQPLLGRVQGGNFQYVEQNATVRSGQGGFNYTTAIGPWTGFSLICASGTATITARVYGYRKS